MKSVIIRAPFCYLTILNVSKDLRGSSRVTTLMTFAFGGPDQHHLTNCSICPGVPVAVISTVSSCIFLTCPFIFNAVANSLVLCRKNTPCTFPDTVMETVFSISKLDQVHNFFKIALIRCIKLIRLFAVNVQYSYYFMITDNWHHNL